MSLKFFKRETLLTAPPQKTTILQGKIVQQSNTKNKNKKGKKEGKSHKRFYSTHLSHPTDTQVHNKETLTLL